MYISRKNAEHVETYTSCLYNYIYILLENYLTIMYYFYRNISNG